MGPPAMTVRHPAVAGLFYPGLAAELAADVARLLERAMRGSEARAAASKAIPKAIIAPHAGYVYSGPIAASAYALLAAGRGVVRRVVLVGPAHRAAFRGLALPSVGAFRTPLGEVRLDVAAIDRLRSLPQMSVRDSAHAGEHSLEVHLPFLQCTIGEFTLVPIVHCRKGR